MPGVDARVLDRYGRRRWRRHHKEYRFRLLGALAGRRIVDVGCGTGNDVLTCAALGARVVGIDASADAVVLARRRIVEAGLADRAAVVQGRLEDDILRPASFDVVWVDQLLCVTPHRVAELMPHLVRLAKPDGVVCLAEPVSRNAFLRALPRLLGVSRPGPAAERPLDPVSFGALLGALDRPRVHAFRLLARLDQHLLPPLDYETGPRWFRAVVDGVAGLDYALLSLPGLGSSGAMAVIVGRPRTPAGA